MSSASPDSEMGLDSEECEICYIAEVETEGIDESKSRSRLYILEIVSDVTANSVTITRLDVKNRPRQ